MLAALSIRDVVLIEALDLEFSGGLGVLTGETGAGKSILLDALGLALGARAESGLVRQGAAQAVVSASFELSAEHPARALLADNALDPEPGEPLAIRRVLKADGGSRAFVNDQPASVALLRELGGALIEVHGQHDERGLLDPRGHRALLDAFARIDGRACAAAWRAWAAAEAALATARAALDEAAREREWLDHAVAELAGLAPEPGEEEMLAGERTAMQKGGRLADDVAAVLGELTGSDGALAKLRQAARRLDRIAGEDEGLAAVLAALDRAVIEAAEAEDGLDQATRRLAFDPARLDAIEVRLFDLRGLARKHRTTPDALAELLAELSGRLERIEAGGAEIARLEAAVPRAAAAYEREAAALSAARAAAVDRLDRAVAGELVPLKLDAARFRTNFAAADPGPTGRDRVEFLISTNPGAPFGPLAKIASGGELSRFVLALKVALAEEGGATTMVFDEIDRGVGGAVASAVGERLARLALTAQVLVVTHSPQVAARADRHWLIAKRSDGLVARTGVHILDEPERREEIARMLSGAQVTEEARAQATRLLEAA